MTPSTLDAAVAECDAFSEFEPNLWLYLDMASHSAADASSVVSESYLLLKATQYCRYLTLQEDTCLMNKWMQNAQQWPDCAHHMNVAGSRKSDCICCSTWRSFHLQERLAEISAERAAKKLAAHQAAEQKLKEAAMPPRMQLAAQVEYACCHMILSKHCSFAYACWQHDMVNQSYCI